MGSVKGDKKIIHYLGRDTNHSRFGIPIFVRLAWANSKGWKFRLRPDNGKCLAISEGVLAARIDSTVSVW